MTYRVTDEVLSWMAQVLNEDPEFDGVDVRYDCAITAMPDGSQEDRWVPLLTLYLAIDGIKPDQDIFGTPVLRPYAVTEEYVKDLTRDGLRSLLKLREELSAEVQPATGS